MISKSQISQRANKNSAQHFKLALADYLGVHNQTTIELVPSARFGLEKLLQDQLGERRSVLVPCFNCSVVQEFTSCWWDNSVI